MSVQAVAIVVASTIVGVVGQLLARHALVSSNRAFGVFCSPAISEVLFWSGVVMTAASKPVAGLLIAGPASGSAVGASLLLLMMYIADHVLKRLSIEPSGRIVWFVTLTVFVARLVANA